MSKTKLKAKNKKIIYSLALIPLIVVLFLLGWFFSIIFEGEKPSITLQPLPEFLAGTQKFTLNISDMKRGLKTVKVSVNQEGRGITVLEEKFPFKGLLNRQGVHQYKKEISIDPSMSNLAQGRVDLNVQVRDYSRRGGGDGNLEIANHKMKVDTIPPAIRTISRMHNINIGGICLVVYQPSSDTLESGIFVGDYFSQGYPAGGESKKGIRVCYFAISHDSSSNPSIYLWAKDRAGNQSRSTFYNHIRRKRFRMERINITDKFLKHVLPYFSFYPLNPTKSDIQKFIKINNDLRKENHKTLHKILKNTSPEKLWEGPWVRLKNAATMARFGDRRHYYYKGKKVDEKIHLGVDLASLANAPVHATNNGRVIFAERFGIYGLTVILDHGQGLSSFYGHLGKIEVKNDQVVKKGENIGFTGRTGLAGGDHLHYGITVNGVFVNPIELWDGHWIEDNITRKLALTEE